MRLLLMSIATVVFIEKDQKSFVDDPARVTQLRHVIDDDLNVRHYRFTNAQPHKLALH